MHSDVRECTPFGIRVRHRTWPHVRCRSSSARDHAMPRSIVRPDKLDLDSPGRRDYWVALEHDSIWGDHLLPLTVWVGPQAKPGRGLVAFGSNHGNEYEGPVALKGLL